MGSEEAELRIWAANSLHTAANRINGELTAGEEFDCKLIRRNFSEVLVIFLFDMDFFFFFPQRRRDEKKIFEDIRLAAQGKIDLLTNARSDKWSGY